MSEQSANASSLALLPESTKNPASRLLPKLPFSFGSYPKNAYLLAILLVLNHLVAVVEIVSAIWVNSLALFAHASHLMLDSIVFTGILTSLLINWQFHKRYSLVHVSTDVVRANLVSGVLFLAGAAAIGYLGARNLSEPPLVKYASLFYLIPVPAFFFNLVAVYVVLHGNKHPEEIQEQPCPVERKSARGVCLHVLANALGSLVTIVSTVLVQVRGLVIADAVCSVVLVMLMVICALWLIKESIDVAAHLREQQRPKVSNGSYFMKHETHLLTNVFTVDS